MTIEQVTEQFEKAADKMPTLGKSLKFQFDEGIVHLDLTGDQAVVSNDDKEADTTITTSLETLDGLRKGKVNPMMAVMSGKVKIKGDVTIDNNFKDQFSNDGSDTILSIASGTIELNDNKIIILAD